MASFGVFVDMGFERRGFLPNRLLPEEAGVEGLWGSGFMVYRVYGLGQVGTLNHQNVQNMGLGFFSVGRKPKPERSSVLQMVRKC